MKVLGIETSCDDTGLAVIDVPGKDFDPDQIKALSDLISSQTAVHRAWGGIVPNLARREHQKNIIPLLKQALVKSNSVEPKYRWRLDRNERKIIEGVLSRDKILVRKLKRFLLKWNKPDIDLIAVTIGPGLEPALWVGANLALTLSRIWEIPLIGVDHLEAHIMANWLTDSQPRKWPNVALVVSGGHTELVFMKELNSYEIIGQTRDDAAGECFDKSARLLNLGYPGGPIISRLAEKWRKLDQAQVPASIKEISLPRPMLHSPDYDFSFSGLKTAISHRHRQFPEEMKSSPYYSLKMASEIEDAINDVLIAKTIKAAREYNAQGILIGGGVSANQSLRKRLIQKATENNFDIFIPPIHLCTDNASVIAITGYLHSKKATLSDTIEVSANLNLNNG